jgi:hypothetical protein
VSRSVTTYNASALSKPDCEIDSSLVLCQRCVPERASSAAIVPSTLAT